MGQINYRDIQKKAISYANRHGKEQDAEDFAQECLMYAFKHQISEIFIARRFSDYIRSNYGRAGTPGGDARLGAASHTEEYIDGVVGAESSDRFSNRSFGNTLNWLSRYQRLIYVLYHKYDITLTQIADSQGVSESRISQVLKGIQEAIDKNIARKESRISRNGEAEVEKILCEQRQGLEFKEDSFMAEVKSFAMESFDG